MYWPEGDFDLDIVPGAPVFVVFPQTLAKAVGLTNTDDRIALLIEGLTAPQSFDRDVVFLYVVRRAVEILRANIP